MIIIGMLLSLAATSLFCWLLFTLAVYALPVLGGASAAILAYRIGAGFPVAFLFGLATARLTLGFGRVLLETARTRRARNLFALAFVLPATIAGYHAVHGIAKLTIPSPIWQVAFSIAGAAAIGAIALGRVTAAAASRPSPAIG